MNGIDLNKERITLILSKLMLDKSRIYLIGLLHYVQPDLRKLNINQK